jgi:uncharacterized membrane protein YcaP (DUF421 family)
MEIVLRSTAIFFFLFVVVRWMGRRQLSEMSAFELLVLVTMGDLVQQGVTQEDMSVTGAVLSVGTMAVWSIVLGYVTYRWRRTEPVITGFPVMIIRDGRPIEDALAVERVPIDEVLEAARQQGIDDLGKIRVGILEADGRFSFIRADDREPSPRTLAPPRHE